MNQNIKIKGINIAYNKVGSGHPMILMHGWGCDSSALRLFERVGSEHHEVYNIDLRDSANQMNLLHHGV